MWASAGQRKPDAACGLNDTRSDLEQLLAQGGKFGDGERMEFWNGLAQFEHQPISGCMEEEPHLIGERRPAGGAIRGQLALVQLIRFSIWPRAQ